MFYFQNLLVSPVTYQALVYHSSLPNMYSYQQEILSLTSQCQQIQTLVEQNQRNLQQAEAERDRLALENEALRRISESAETEQKRRYRKRRKNLEKHIGCTVPECKSRFSSDMAFRNHQRKRHNIRKRLPQESS